MTPVDDVTKSLSMGRWSSSSSVPDATAAKVDTVGSEDRSASPNILKLCRVTTIPLSKSVGGNLFWYSSSVSLRIAMQDRRSESRLLSSTCFERYSLSSGGMSINDGVAGCVVVGNCVFVTGAAVTVNDAVVVADVVVVTGAVVVTGVVFVAGAVIVASCVFASSLAATDRLGIFNLSFFTMGVGSVVSVGSSDTLTLILFAMVVVLLVLG
jgi:hypothetical protein